MKNRILKSLLLGVMLIGATASLNAARITGKAGSGSKSRNTGIIARNNNGNYIGVNRAKAIALKRIPGANASHIHNVHLDREDGRMVYEGEIYYNGWEYEFDIDAVTGQIVKWKKDRD